MPVTTVSPVTPSATQDVASIVPRKGSRSRPLFDPPIVRRAITDSLVKLNPRTMMKNPVMFVVEVGAVMTTFLALRDLAIDRDVQIGEGPKKCRNVGLYTLTARRRSGPGSVIDEVRREHLVKNLELALVLDL